MPVLPVQVFSLIERIFLASIAEVAQADLAKLYLENWMEHKAHSEAYQGRY
jgi:hypothetical protein